jgi:hypothetical protein
MISWSGYLSEINPSRLFSRICVTTFRTSTLFTLIRKETVSKGLGFIGNGRVISIAGVGKWSWRAFHSSAHPSGTLPDMIHLWYHIMLILHMISYVLNCLWYHSSMISYDYDVMILALWYHYYMILSIYDIIANIIVNIIYDIMFVKPWYHVWYQHYLMSMSMIS